jgi:hypothetical protein
LLALGFLWLVDPAVGPAAQVLAIAKEPLSAKDIA